MDSQIENIYNEVIIEIYNVELNNGKTLYLTSNNQNVSWGNNVYLAFPVIRDETTQEDNSVGNIGITLGDPNSILTKSIISNISIAKNALITIFQSRESFDSGISTGFKQVFKGRIIAMSFTPGQIIFDIVAPYTNPQRSINNKKFGEFKGMIDVFRDIY